MLWQKFEGGLRRRGGEFEDGFTKGKEIDITIPHAVFCDVQT